MKKRALFRACSLLLAGFAVAAEGRAQHTPHRAPDERSPVQIINRATAYDKAGDAQKASEVLIAAVKANPASARLTDALVVFLANHGSQEDAFRLAQQFSSRYPGNVDGQKLYLRVLVATGQATAGPLAHKLLAAAPKDGELLYLNGALEQKAGELSEAREHLQQSVVINPEFAQSRYSLGVVLARLEDAAGAKQQLEQAIRLGSPEPEAHLELSKVLRALGDGAAADEQVRLYQGTLKANVDREMAASKSADAAQAMAGGDAVKAAQLYREALDASPRDGRLAYQLALALDKAGDSAGERGALEQAVQIDAGLALAQHQLGYLLYREGEYTGAEEHFRMAVKDDPSFTQAWISLGAALATNSKPAEAQDAVGHALRLDPKNAQAVAMKRQLMAAQAGR